MYAYLDSGILMPDFHTTAKITDHLEIFFSKDGWGLIRVRRCPYPHPRKQNHSESEVAIREGTLSAPTQPDGGEARRGMERDGGL
jgi:hypothetical protein